MSEKPCPSCGYCPTCGRQNANPYYPWTYPYRFITWGGTSGTTDVPNFGSQTIASGATPTPPSGCSH